MPIAPASNREIVNTRLFHATPAALFAAFSNPERLARWWGPNGFSNTFHEFDFRTGGDWRFIMHGPDGTDYENYVIFTEILPCERIVLQHIPPPKFQLTMIFTEQNGKTQLTWRQEFETAAQRDKILKFVGDANEQNFDRLEAELAREA